MEKIGKDHTDPGSTPGASTDVRARKDTRGARPAGKKAPRVASASQNSASARSAAEDAILARAFAVEIAARYALSTLVTLRHDLALTVQRWNLCALAEDKLRAALAGVA